MDRPLHYYGLNHLYFLTTCTYRRARLCDSERFKHFFYELETRRRGIERVSTREG